MAVLSDIVVAPLGDTTALLEASQTSSRWKVAEWKGFSEVNLVQLWAILDNSHYDVSLLQRFRVIASSKSGPWAIVIPDELTTKLAVLDDKALSEAASRWKETEELMADR